MPESSCHITFEGGATIAVSMSADDVLAELRSLRPVTDGHLRKLTNNGRALYVRSDRVVAIEEGPTRRIKERS